MLHDPPAPRTVPEPAALRPGEPRTIGPFRVRSRLGSGGMGDVYLGAARRGRQVAIKLIRGAQLDDGEFRARFAREVRAAAKVRSRFIANLVDADPDADLPWLATEYAPGPTLSQELAARGPLDQDSVLDLVAGVAEALREVHRAGLVHRDVKPANVILGHDGPRLIDLGVVATVDATRLTLTGQPVGTPVYMAPEQAAGSRATSAADVWSLGALAYFAATGNRLFEGDHPAVVLYRVSSEPPSYDDAPAYLRPLLDACLLQDPDQRPTLDAILHFLGADARTPAPDTRADPAAPLAHETAPSETTPLSTPSPTAGTPTPGTPTPGTPIQSRAADRSGDPSPYARPSLRGRTDRRRAVSTVVAAAVVVVALAGSALTVLHYSQQSSPDTPVRSGQVLRTTAPLDETGQRAQDTGLQPQAGRDSWQPAALADGSPGSPWPQGTVQPLAENSCWEVGVTEVRGDVATLTISCNQAGTSAYGTPTPSEWLTVYAVGADGLTSQAAPTDASAQDTFWTQGNLADASPVTTTVTLPRVGQLAAVSVQHRDGYGWYWDATA